MGWGNTGRTHPTKEQKRFKGSVVVAVVAATRTPTPVATNKQNLSTVIGLTTAELGWLGLGLVFYATVLGVGDGLCVD